MEELIAVLKSYRDRADEDRRFFAAIQGVDLGEKEIEDISTLKDRQAEFGIGMGLGYEVEGD